MIEVGLKSEIAGADLLKPLVPEPKGRPRMMPRVPRGFTIICGYRKSEVERIIVCDTLADMTALHDASNRSLGERLVWYVGPKPSALTPTVTTLFLPALTYAPHITGEGTVASKFSATFRELTEHGYCLKDAMKHLLVLFDQCNADEKSLTFEDGSRATLHKKGLAYHFEVTDVDGP